MPVSVNDAQRMILSSAYHGTGEVFEAVKPEWLAEPYRAVAQALHALHQRREAVTIASLGTECARRGFTPRIETWMMGPVAAETAVNAYIAARGREAVEQAILRAQQMLAVEDVDAFMVAGDLSETLGGIERPKAVDEKYAWSYEEVFAFIEAPTEWVIPGLLARRDRFVLTAEEGVGKSTWLYQVALCAGYGINPVDPAKRYERRRVVVLDVENTHETQVAWAYRKVHNGIQQVLGAGDDRSAPDVELLTLRDIDLLSPTQRHLFLDVIEASQPDLLVMGSGYKLVDATDDWRAMAEAVHRTVDRVKARVGCAVLIETHAGHGSMEDRNGLRPEGSSNWRKWPEFGHGLAATTDSSIVETTRWRRDRPSYGKNWPRGWEKSEHGLPWRAIPEDEWDARDLDTLRRSSAGKTSGWSNGSH
jgi:replicative DNA helicase